MKDLSKRGLDYIKKKKVWRLWRSGKTLSEIGLTVDRHAGSIFGVLKLNGGMSPVQRKRRDSFLILQDREINRNGGSVKYRAIAADKHALKKALRPKEYKLRKFSPISKLVEAKLLDDWSPGKISGWLKRTHKKSPEMQVSHETIYKTLFILCREVFDMEALTHLRSKRKLRHGKRSTKKGIYKGIIDAKTIHERPSEIEGRTTLGHWEGDLVLEAITPISRR